MAAIDEQVADTCQRYLTAIDAAVPGLVSGLYLVGSLALGDFQPGRSDIDFVAVTSRALVDDDVTMLREVHAGLVTSASFDGVYLDGHELASPPDDERPAPHTLHGEFKAGQPCSQLTPVTWAEFSRYGVTLRGRTPSQLGVRPAPARLHYWTLGNLAGYWQRLADQGEKTLRGREPHAEANAETVAWSLLGCPRLHFTLATGDIASKSAAGSYAADIFPDYAELIEAARTWRATGAGAFTTSDALRSVEFVRAVISDARSRWEVSTPPPRLPPRS